MRPQEAVVTEEFEAYEFLGRVATEQGRFDVARAALEQARALVPAAASYAISPNHLACDRAIVELAAGDPALATAILDAEKFEHAQAMARAIVLWQLAGSEEDEEELGEALAYPGLREDRPMFVDLCTQIARFAPYRAEYVSPLREALGLAQAMGTRRADEIEGWLGGADAAAG